MTAPLTDLLRRYRAKGVLVDTNILLLYFIGRFDRGLIPRFKRTSDRFVQKDFQVLSEFLSKFARIATTPNILSEVNSLSGQLGEPAKTRYFEGFAREIAMLDEHYVKSRDACKVEAFARLGLTDSAIFQFARDKHLVLTDDMGLYVFCEKGGVDVINFNHIRTLVWT